MSVRYALRCRFPFSRVENQPLGVVFGVAVWGRARFGGVVTGCGCDKSPLVGGSGGGAPIVRVSLFLLPVYLCYWCGIGGRFARRLLSVV